MDDETDQALESANWPADLVASIRELIGSLKPGEILRYDEDIDGTAFYERCAADYSSIESRYLDGDLGTETTSDAILPELDKMVARGELIEGPGCSEWTRL